MAFDPCLECGAAWYARHKSTCSIAAAKFLKSLKDDGHATSDTDPRCPKCGMPNEHWTDSIPFHAGDGSTLSLTCENCEQDYSAELVISYSFRVTA